MRTKGRRKSSKASRKLTDSNLPARKSKANTEGSCDLASAETQTSACTASKAYCSACAYVLNKPNSHENGAIASLQQRNEVPWRDRVKAEFSRRRKKRRAILQARRGLKTVDKE